MSELKITSQCLTKRRVNQARLFTPPTFFYLAANICLIYNKVLLKLVFITKTTFWMYGVKNMSNIFNSWLPESLHIYIHVVWSLSRRQHYPLLLKTFYRNLMSDVQKSKEVLYWIYYFILKCNKVKKMKCIIK
jgi:hypothetical protein